MTRSEKKFQLNWLYDSIIITGRKYLDDPTRESLFKLISYGFDVGMYAPLKVVRAFNLFMAKDSKENFLLFINSVRKKRGLRILKGL